MLHATTATTSHPPAADVEAPSFDRPSWSRRLLELLLVGGITPLLFPLSWALRAWLGLDDAELMVGALFFYAAFVVNDPHFAVTYVLFYKHARARSLGEVFSPAQRLRYVLAGFAVPALLLAWALVALWTRSVLALGLMFQLMFLLVGWHYVKQGFGILTILAARRGVRFGTSERRVLLAHCYAGWAYAWASPYDPGYDTEQKGLVYRTLAHPPGLELAAGLVFLLSVLPLCWIFVRATRRSALLRLRTPLLAFLCTVWLWTLYSSIDPLVRYAIPALHSAQYLYMVWLLKRNEAREREQSPWFEASAGTRLALLAVTSLGLGWLLFHGAPDALDALLTGARTPLGPTPYFAALFAFVNIHHYFMDMVIWRRDNPLTRYLHVI